MAPKTFGKPGVIILVMASAIFFLCSPVLANPIVTEQIRAEFGSVVSTILPGSSFWTVLHLHAREGWHTFWRHPGDSGRATAIHWILPEGFEAGDIAWPYPQRIPIGARMHYGYEGDVYLLSRITAPTDIPTGTSITLRANVSWMACADTCISERATLALRLPVSAGAPTLNQRWVTAFAEAQQAIPQAVPWDVSFASTSKALTLSVAAPDLVTPHISDMAFFPLQSGVIDQAAPQEMLITKEGFALTIPRGTLRHTVLTRVDGVLVLTEIDQSGPVTRAFSISAMPTTSTL